MAVYSVLLNTQDIIKQVIKHNPKRTLIIACGGCANESLAYDRHEPIFSCESGQTIQDALKSGMAVPYATKMVTEQLEEIIKTNGYEVDICTVPIGESTLCIQDINSQIINKNITQGVELVLALCCPAGIMGIKRAICDIPVVPLMISKGQLFYIYKDKENNRQIVYDQSRVIVNLNQK